MQILKSKRLECYKDLEIEKNNLIRKGMSSIEAKRHLVKHVNRDHICCEVKNNLKVWERISQLIQNLSHSDPEIQKKSVKILGKIGSESKEAIPDLIHLLKNSEPDCYTEVADDDSVCSVIVNTLIRIGLPSKRVISALINASGYYLEFDLVPYALGEIGRPSERVIETLVRCIMESGDIKIDVPIEALLKLGKFSIEPIHALTHLQNKLIDPCMRRDIVNSLGEIGLKVAVPILLQAINDSEPSVRIAVIEALAKIGLSEDEVVPILLQAINDSEPSVRIAVIEALAEIGPSAKGAVPSLIENLNDPDDEIRDCSFVALEAIGQNAVPTLIEALNDPNIRDDAISILGNIGPEAAEAIPSLLKLLLLFPVPHKRQMEATINHKNGGNREEVANALRNICKEAKELIPIIKTGGWNELNTHSKVGSMLLTVFQDKELSKYLRNLGFILEGVK